MAREGVRYIDIVNDPVSEARRIEEVVAALQRVGPEDTQTAMDIAGLPKEEIAAIFNDACLKVFRIVGDATQQSPSTKGYYTSIKSYENQYKAALLLGVDVPMRQFILVLLKQAPGIYLGNEQGFLDMAMPDAKIASGPFGVIRCEEFKQLWISLRPDIKDDLRDQITMATTYAHAYFIKVSFASITKA